MLGHSVFRHLEEEYLCFATFRSRQGAWSQYPFYQDSSRLIFGIDALRFETIIRAFVIARPAVVVNCIGLIKQIPVATDHALSIQLNALFPHQLASLCAATGSRLIHFSTDCVFSGKKGMYTEDDFSDANDLYGRSKFLGEVQRQGAVTLRTSIIGWALGRDNGLLEWFRSNRGGTVRGFRKAIFSGLSSSRLAGLVSRLIADLPKLSGIYHVASPPIDKNQLLLRLGAEANLEIRVEPCDTPQLDRSLDPSLFRRLTGCTLPDWDEMIPELAIEFRDYELWRESNAATER